METTREYKLLQSYDGIKMHHHRSFANSAAARVYAAGLATREEKHFYIELVVTTRSVDDIFTVPALPPPSIKEIAQDMAAVYMESIDWSNNEYMLLSEEDKAKVRAMVHEDTDDCEICGWTFQIDYLGHGDYGLVCDRCEDEQENNNE